MLILRVGDPHVKHTNIEESDKLMNFVLQTALERKVGRIELLGDLFHTHSVLRLEVLEFWDTWLDSLSDAQELVVLVGNHDQSGDTNADSNALRVFRNINKDNLRIIETATNIGNIGYLPYVHHKEEFTHLANELAGYGAKVLVCHQTFTGSKFESGIYAPDGIDPETLTAPLIISGHIHSQQRFGKVIYPGTAKWDTASDANERKGIWLFEHDDVTGVILSEEFISTENVVTPILSFTWKEGEEQPVVPENSRSTLELIGSSDWIAMQKPKFKVQFSVKTKITDRAKAENRKTGRSFEEFIKNHYVGNSVVDKGKLFEYMRGLNLV